MTDFKKVYGCGQVNNAVSARRKAIIFYCAVSLVFACVCATFVALYVTVNLNIFVCFIINFLITAAFIWFSVIFFKLVFSVIRDNVRFFKMQESALITYARGFFAGIAGEGKEVGLGYVYLTFDTVDGQKKYRIKQGTQIPFDNGVRYDLELAGDLVLGYAEAENE